MTRLVVVEFVLVNLPAQGGRMVGPPVFAEKREPGSRMEAVGLFTMREAPPRAEDRDPLTSYYVVTDERSPPVQR